MKRRERADVAALRRWVVTFDGESGKWSSLGVSIDRGHTGKWPDSFGFNTRSDFTLEECGEKEVELDVGERWVTREATESHRELKGRVGNVSLCRNRKSWDSPRLSPPHLPHHFCRFSAQTQPFWFASEATPKLPCRRRQHFPVSRLRIDTQRHRQTEGL